MWVPKCQSTKKKKVLTFGERKHLSTKGEGWSHKRKRGVNFRGKLLHKLQYNATKVGSRLVENENQQNKALRKEQNDYETYLQLCFNYFWKLQSAHTNDTFFSYCYSKHNISTRRSSQNPTQDSSTSCTLCVSSPDACDVWCLWCGSALKCFVPIMTLSKVGQWVENGGRKKESKINCTLLLLCFLALLTTKARILCLDSL